MHTHTHTHTLEASLFSIFRSLLLCENLNLDSLLYSFILFFSPLWSIFVVVVVFVATHVDEYQYNILSLFKI